MRTKLVPIGNSRGVRLPKPMIEEAQLEGEVELVLRDRAIVITAARKPRDGWAEGARLLHALEADRPLLPGAATHFDREEWEW